MRMFNPPHPGKILNEIWIKPMRLTLINTAAQLKVSRKTLSAIVNGKAPVTADMAVRLELAFGKSAESWLAHQAAYDLWHLQAQKESLGITPIRATNDDELAPA